MESEAVELVHIQVTDIQQKTNVASVSCCVVLLISQPLVRLALLVSQLFSTPATSIPSTLAMPSTSSLHSTLAILSSDNC